MEGYYKEITKLLHKTRKRIIVLILLRGGLYFTGANLVYFNIFCLLDALLEFSPDLRYFFLCFYSVLFALSVFTFLIRPFLKKITDDKAALLIQRENKGLKDGLINFLQLSRKLEKGELKETSREITGEYLKRSFKKIDPGIFSAVKIFPGQKKEIRLFGLLIFVFAVMYLLPPYLMRYSMLRLFDPSLDTASISGFKALTGLPEIGDLKVKVYYPAYTGLGVKIFEEGGNAEVLKNSRLEISGTTNKPIARALAVGNESGKGFNISLNVTNPLRPVLSLVAKEDIEYKISLTDRKGQNNIEQVSHNITLVRDENPQVNMIFPNQELIAVPDSEIKVVYEYADDFGVTAANLVFEKDGKEKRQLLVNNGKPKLHDSGEFDFELTKAGLTFGDEIWLYVEAFDNDTIDGPKRGISQRIKIKLPSLQEYLKEENPMDAEAFKELLKSADDFKNRQEDFLRQVEKFKQQGDPDLARMLADLEGLRNDLVKLAEKLTATAMKVPEEVFKNAEMSRLDMGKIAKLMKELEDAIKRGDKEAAKRLAKELSDAMSEMMESLRKMLDSSGMARMNKMMKKAGELNSEVKEMIEKEKEIYEGTEKEASESLNGLLERQEKAIKEIIKKQQEAADTAAKTINSLVSKKIGVYKENMNNVISNLVPVTAKLLTDFKAKIFSDSVSMLNNVIAYSESYLRYGTDLESKLESEIIENNKKTGTDTALQNKQKPAEEEKNTVSGFNADINKIKELEKEILDILQKSAKGGNKDEGKKPGYIDLKKKQDKLKDKLSGLKEKINSASKDGFPSGAFRDDVTGAEDAMGNASGDLNLGEAYNAISGEQDAISHLENMSNNMNGMMQGGSGSAFMLSSGGRVGTKGTYTGKHKLPQKKEYRPSKEFREDIMDSMKEKLPQKYKDLIDEYYKKLLR